MSQEQRPPASYKKGKWRPYRPVVVASPPPAPSPFFRIVFPIILAATVVIRNLQLEHPVAAEAATIERVVQYSRGEIFVDTQPPLAKLAFYWLSLVLGTTQGVNTIPSDWTRYFPVLLGVLTMALAHATLRASKCGPVTQLLAVALIAVDHTLIVHSNLVSHESLLLFTTALAVYGLQKVQYETPFSRKWYKCLFVAGLGLGLALSTRYSAIFTLAWAGLLAASQLWSLLGDLLVLDVKWFQHLVARVVTLVVWPLTIYCSLFYVHLASLPFNGTGSGLLSPEFKSTLHDSDALLSMPVEVSYGSTVTIKHNQLESYLHSHDFNYRTGSGEQQVTLLDDALSPDNEWIIESVYKNREGELQKHSRPIKDGDMIRFFHKQTGKYMRVHDLRPPISEHDYANEVSCNSSRAELMGDINYDYKIRILAKKPHAVNDLPLIKLRATESVFQLVHQGTKCILMSHKDKLPAWGFGQNEVLCVDEPTIPNTLWYIESNSHPVLDDDLSHPRVAFRPYGFFQKFWEYHMAMLRVHQGQDGQEVEYSSTPAIWPFAIRGRPITSNENGTVYSLGNIPIYYTGLLFVIIGLFNHFFHAVKHLNPFVYATDSQASELYYANSFSTIAGWALHFIPFIYLSTPTFASEYLVSLYFCILLIAQYVEYQISKRKYFGYVLLVLILGTAVTFYLQLLPALNGGWTAEQCMSSPWAWGLACLSFLDIETL
ncbi:glycosyltransferase family 39 protein [Suhomyces tanzawaensis NRRL Y-17324]|uniref:Dolichyl-phosphate-mannose--protein mannosyltransferase n=1 Tax=Suhomyces tanzawaensis NRRL Y-17324 TaxID=984487 RepID=A0A1E4SNK0_9ASCO|nr:glycosyltransferase family 39 protein [Suhomyces tanzawaensis NRRL Y-17324]ODV81104.1 glycosyltransferase family 39 protein [Suhomyces tanzawaensis NRRL Y-17324]